MKIDKNIQIIREFASQLNCRKLDYGNGVLYRLPEENGDSWFIEVQPADGLLLSDAYFSLLKPITYIYNMPENHICICSLYRGNITIVERGKKPRRLYEGMHFLINKGTQVKIIINTDEPIWYTFALLSENFILKYMNNLSSNVLSFLSSNMSLKSTHYNTPNLLLVFEQLKYAIRNCDLSYMYYIGKIYEIFAIILRNIENDSCLNIPRRNHLSYENKQLIWLVKDEIDKNILVPPSIEEMKNIAEMSESKLRRCFKATYNKTIYEYIRSKKMEQAIRFLSHDEMSIHNIATTLGYESASKFSAAFKKIYGITPSAFRESFNL
jgi:AraC-like DNA-binding protein